MITRKFRWQNCQQISHRIPKLRESPGPDCHSQLLEPLQTSAQNLWRVPEATKRRFVREMDQGFSRRRGGRESMWNFKNSMSVWQELGDLPWDFYDVPAFSGHSTSWGIWNVIFYHSTSGLRGYPLVIKHGWKIPYVQLIFPMSSHIFLWFSCWSSHFPWPFLVDFPIKHLDFSIFSQNFPRIFPWFSHVFIGFSHVFIGFPSQRWMPLRCQTPRPSHCWEPTAAAHCGAWVLPRGPRRRLWPGGISWDVGGRMVRWLS